MCDSKTHLYLDPLWQVGSCPWLTSSRRQGPCVRLTVNGDRPGGLGPGRWYPAPEVNEGTPSGIGLQRTRPQISPTPDVG